MFFLIEQNRFAESAASPEEIVCCVLAPNLALDTLLKLPTIRDVVTCLSLRTYKAAGEVGTDF